MGWDKDLPATNEKLRTLSGVITSNWAAIEEADETSGTPIKQRALVLPDRSDAGIATSPDPVVVGATTYVYSKQDAGSVQEAYIKDAASNEIQISQAGTLGSIATDVRMNSMAFDANITFNEDNIIRAWAVVGSAGGIPASSSKHVTSATRSATGKYTVTLDAYAVSSATFCVLITVSKDVVNTATIAGYKNLAYNAGTFVGTFDINIDDEDGNAKDSDFNFCVIGV